MGWNYHRGVGFIFPGDNKNRTGYAGSDFMPFALAGPVSGTVCKPSWPAVNRVFAADQTLILAHRIEVPNRADDFRGDWSATGQTGTPTKFKRGNGWWQEAYCASALKANVVVEKKCWLEVQLSKLKVIGWQIALTAIFFVFKQTIRSLD